MSVLVSSQEEYFFFRCVWFAFVEGDQYILCVVTSEENSSTVKLYRCLSLFPVN